MMKERSISHVFIQSSDNYENNNPSFSIGSAGYS